jgi:hypothetical protein
MLGRIEGIASAIDDAGGAYRVAGQHGGAKISCDSGRGVTCWEELHTERVRIVAIARSSILSYPMFAVYQLILQWFIKLKSSEWHGNARFEEAEFSCGGVASSFISDSSFATSVPMSRRWGCNTHPKASGLIG